MQYNACYSYTLYYPQDSSNASEPDKKGHRYSTQDGSKCIVNPNDVKKWNGFPICMHYNGGGSTDSNGNIYGWENGASCIVKKDQTIKDIEE